MTVKEYEKWVKFWLSNDRFDAEKGMTIEEWLDHPNKVRQDVSRTIRKLQQSNSSTV